MSTQQLPKIKTEPRDRVGSRYAKRARKNGLLPVVIYGHKQDPIHATVDLETFEDILHHHSHLIEVEIGNHTESCLVKEVQWDYLGSQIVHVDLARVDLTEEVEVEVELVLTGEPKALEESGVVLNHPLSELLVTCRADQIPEQITVDISQMQAGDIITVGDLALPPGVKAEADEETLVAQLQVMHEEPEAEEAPAATEEPELIKRGPAEKSEDQGKE